MTERSPVLLDIEHRILTILIQEPRKLGIAGTLVDDSDFSEDRRRIYQALRKLFLEGSPIDALILARTVSPEDDQLMTQYVQRLAGAPCDPNMIAGYCRQLHDAARLERAHSAATGIVYAEDLQTVEERLGELNRLMIQGGRMRAVKAADAAQNFLDRMALDKKPNYLDFGFGSLNDVLFVEPGDFVVLGGYPSAGKTALAAQMALHMSQTRRVGFFSLETRETKLTDRMISALSGVQLRKIKTKELNTADWRALNEGARSLFYRKMEIVEAAGATVQNIQAKSLAERYDVIFIDYLQLITSTGNTRYDKVTEISLQLHTLAQKHGIIVIALAQLQRPEKSQAKEEKGKLIPPNMSSFKESGQIEQDADVGLIIYPENPADNASRRKLKIAKNKESMRQIITLDFDGQHQWFSEAVEDYVPRKKEPSRRKRQDSPAPDQETMDL